MEHHERWFEKVVEQSGRIKIAITTYQTIVLLPESLQLSGQYIGPIFNRMAAALLWVHFDVVRVLPLSCYRQWNYLDSLVAATSLPLALSIFFVLAFHFYLRYYRYQYRPTNRYPQHGLEA
jgi:hypothetical protein